MNPTAEHTERTALGANVSVSASPQCQPPMTNNRRIRILAWLLPLLAVVIASACAFVWAMDDYGARIAPPGETANLEDFFTSAKAPPVFRVEKYLHDGRTFTVLTGKIPSGFSSWIVLPSGPPVYIFDDSYTLTDWVADSGESPWLAQWIRESKLLADSPQPPPAAEQPPTSNP